MADSYSSPNEYIGHHLAFNELQIGDSPFWTLNLDSVVVSIILGILTMGFIWWFARKATSDVPTKTQAFVELIFTFIDNQVKATFHGDRHSFVAPAAMTVFLWVFMMNAMDFLPIDIMATILGWFGNHEWRNGPTADVNTTFALA